MPELEEVFRLATNKVRPDPDALERQQRRQRSAARTSRVRAYVAVAAVLILVGVGAVAVFNAVGGDEKIPADNGSGTPGELTFRQSLPAGANEQIATIVDLQGHQTSKVSGLPVDAYAPSVSADGSTIAFIAAPTEAGYNQIGVMDMDGGGPRFIATPGIIVGFVATSPDGSTIAFEGVQDLNTDIYVIGIDGSDLRRLTDDPATDQYPQWSPDGTTIVYDNEGSRGEADPQFTRTTDVWTVPADGGGAPTQLTTSAGADSSPSFSPSGKQIAYFHDGEVRTMAADGSDQHQLVPGSKGGFTPRWSPDGTQIAFTYYSDASTPLVQLGQDFSSRPLVILAVVDVATGRVTKLENIGMATDLNTPQWVDNDHLLVMRVPV